MEKGFSQKIFFPQIWDTLKIMRNSRCYNKIDCVFVAMVYSKVNHGGKEMIKFFNESNIFINIL